MIWKPLTLLEYKSEDDSWTKRHFEEYKEYVDFLYSCYRFPGQYNLKNTDAIRANALKYIKDKRYTDYHPKSKEYKEFWLNERRKCEQGVIFDNMFIPGSLYMWWNFLPIFNKIEMRERHPEPWDSHLYYAHYLELAWLEDKDGCCVKARQKGISLYHVARLVHKIWFGNKVTTKIVAYEEEYVLGEWNILEGYRAHLNQHTGFYRAFSPDEKLNWEQKIEVTVGEVDKKKFFKGNFSRIKGSTTKKNLSKAVGGPALEIYATEAGIYQNLKKVKEYVDANLKMGSVKTGIFVAAGAVGELKDAADLQEFAFNPSAYGIKSVKDVFSGSLEDICFFFPDEFNYVYKDEETGKVVKCYDKDGNSDIELAIKYLNIEEEKVKNKDATALKLYKSQHCRTLQDAFDQRDDNPFPTHLLKARELELISAKDIVVKLERDSQGKVVHRFCNDTPINTLKVNPEADNRGAVVIWEFPMANPPLGLYYAGVDPIRNLDTSTSKSLFSITIRIAMHEREGKIVEDYPVATYIGRHKKAVDTFQVALDLIEFYNAQTAVENNVTDFIEWMIRQGKSKYLMRRKQLKVIAELTPNSSISDEIGVRMEGEFKKRCYEKLITELEEPISESFDLTTGESKTIYGVSKYKDLWFIRECLKYTPKLNADRQISNILAKIACDSSANRHIIKSLNHAPKPKQEVPRNLPSAFKSSLPSSFGRKLKGHF